MFIRTITVWLSALALVVVLSGAFVYVKDRFEQHEDESAQFAENERMLISSNNQLAEKAKRATQSAERSHRLRIDSLKRSKEKREAGCSELDELIPKCIADLRRSNYADYMKARNATEDDK